MNINFRNGHGFSSMLKSVTIRRGMAWGIIIICALLAFEIFNYSTTQFALADVLGDLKFANIQWATILALAFCGIDFAGIARLFTPQKGREEPGEVWYLFSAWILAAAMNATLTWWGVAVAISSHTNMSSAVINSNTLTRVVPVFVAIMVWLIRVLIIGTFSVSGDRLFGQKDTRPVQHSARPAIQPASSMTSLPRSAVSTSFRQSQKVAHADSTISHAEPTYHNLSMTTRSVRDAEYVDKPLLS
jgi:hypothetical protein